MSNTFHGVVPGKTRLMFDPKEQALDVKEGYKFLT